MPGIARNKKNDIVNKLSPLMPENRQRFLSQLAVNNESEDLIDNP